MYTDRDYPLCTTLEDPTEAEMSCYAEDQNSVLHELYAREVIPLSYAGDYSSHRFAQQMLAWPVTTKNSICPITVALLRHYRRQPMTLWNCRMKLEVTDMYRMEEANVEFSFH